MWTLCVLYIASRKKEIVFVIPFKLTTIERKRSWKEIIKKKAKEKKRRWLLEDTHTTRKRKENCQTKIKSKYCEEKFNPINDKVWHTYHQFSSYIIISLLVKFHGISTATLAYTNTLKPKRIKKKSKEKEEQKVLYPTVTNFLFI